MTKTRSNLFEVRKRLKSQIDLNVFTEDQSPDHIKLFSEANELLQESKFLWEKSINAHNQMYLQKEEANKIFISHLRKIKTEFRDESLFWKNIEQNNIKTKGIEAWRNRIRRFYQSLITNKRYSKKVGDRININEGVNKIENYERSLELKNSFDRRMMQNKLNLKRVIQQLNSIAL